MIGGPNSFSFTSYSYKMKFFGFPLMTYKLPKSILLSLYTSFPSSLNVSLVLRFVTCFFQLVFFYLAIHNNKSVLFLYLSFQFPCVLNLVVSLLPYLLLSSIHSLVFCTFLFLLNFDRTSILQNYHYIFKLFHQCS